MQHRKYLVPIFSI